MGMIKAPYSSISSILASAGRGTTAAVSASFAFAILEAIAVFNSGGYFMGTMTLCVVASWIVLFLLVFFSSEGNHLVFAKTSIAVIVPFLLFWLWTSASTYWSIASDLSWVEANRTGGYLALLIIGMFIGRNKTARSLAAVLFLFIAAAAAIYAIGVKAFPSVISNYRDYGRVVVPLGYVNATGLMFALAIPQALFFSAGRKSSATMRFLAAVAAMLLLMALFFTLSRGAMLALAIGLIIYFVLSPIRIRSLAMLAIALAPTLLIALWSSSQSALMDQGVDRELRLQIAAPLRWYIAAGILFVVIATMLVVLIDKKITFSRRVITITGTTLLILIGAFAIGGTAYFISTRDPSFRNWAGDAYTKLTSGQRQYKEGTQRLAEIGTTTGRWQIWQEAITSWQEKPVYGYGAQSFPLTHLMLREPGVMFVKQPHGLFFGLLSELGLVGLVIFSAFLCLSIGLASMLIQKLGVPEGKGLAVAFLSSSIIFLVHTGYDWDWNMFALTMPYFLFTGILVGWFGNPRCR